MSRKKKRSIIDEFFRNSLFNDSESMLQQFPETGYSISIVQTSEGTKVTAKVGKNTDANGLRKQLQQQYPNAKIEIQGGKTGPLIREISTKTLKAKSENEENSKTEK